MNDDLSKKNNWMLASLLLNAFLVAGIASSAVCWFKYQHNLCPDRIVATKSENMVAARVPYLPSAADGLSSEQRQAFRDGLHNLRRDVAGLTKTSRESRLEISRLLSEPELDRQAIDAALARTRVADSEIRQLIETYVVTYAVALPPVDREYFALGLPRLQGPFHVITSRPKP